MDSQTNHYSGWFGVATSAALIHFSKTRMERKQEILVRKEPNVYHFWQYQDLTDDGDLGTFSVNVNVPFPVKKIKINFGYIIEAAEKVMFLITCPMLNNQLVGVLDKWAYTDAVGPVFNFIDKPTQNNVFEFVFPLPQIISQNIDFNFEERFNHTAITQHKNLIHMEFISE